MKHVAGSLVLLAGCGVAVEVSPDAAAPDADIVTLDAAAIPIDAAHARCDAAKPFGAPVVVARLDSAFDDAALTLTRNERIALLGRENTPASLILSSTRAMPSASFEAPTPAGLEQLNAVAGTEHHPSITGNGMRVYFERRSVTSGIFAAVRADVANAFSAGSPVNVGGVALTAATAPVIAGNGETLYWVDSASSSLRVASRAGSPFDFGEAIVASTVTIASPVLSDDELTIFYSEAGEIVGSTRSTTTEPFAAGTAVTEVNSSAVDYPLFVTADGCVLFLASQRAGGIGGVDVWRAERAL